MQFGQEGIVMIPTTGLRRIAWTAILVIGLCLGATSSTKASVTYVLRRVHKFVPQRLHKRYNHTVNSSYCERQF